MRVPLEMSFRGVQKTEAIEALIREKLEKLEQVCGHMTSCRLVVEQPQDAQKVGNPFRVRIEVRVPPGHEIVVKREPGEQEVHPGVEGVLRSAFDSARRQLRELMDRQRGEVKAHKSETASQGIVVKLFPERGYGFLKSLEGLEVYFHRNSLPRNGFDELSVGSVVRYVEEEGEKGPQASTVRIVERGAETDETEAAGLSPLGWERAG